MSVDPGLCAGCAHKRIVRSRRGSAFLLCGLSRTDPRYPRYPRLPVLACDGYRPRTRSDGADQHEDTNPEEHA